MSIQSDVQILRQCTGGAHERLIYVIPKHMARATGDLNMAWIMSQVVFWQQYNMENHGHVWVIKPAKEWQAEFGMTRREFDGAIETLIANFGLQKKVIKSPYYNNNTTLCLRFDPHILWSKLENELNCSFQNVQNEQSEMAKMSNPLFTEVRTEDTNIKDMHPTPNGVGAGLSKDSNSKKKATPNTPSNQAGANLPPAPRPAPNVNDSADTPIPKGLALVFREICLKVFNISDGVPLDGKTAGQVQRLASYLWNETPRPSSESLEDKGAGLVADITAFTRWYAKKTNNAFFPRSPEKLGTYWLEFVSSRIAPPPTANYTIEEWGGNTAKIGDTNFPATGDGGGKMELDRGIFGFLFDNRKDNES